MIILLFGPPGCGKGTQAAFLLERLQIPSISTGEMFRAECAAGTSLGNRTRAILARGGLIGDDIVNGMVEARIGQADCAKGFLLDGYPRTVEQARFFTRLLNRRKLSEAVLVHLDVPADALVERLTARRQCPQCMRIYNLLSQPPRSGEVCDHDGAALIRREDDREATIRARIHAYHQQTGPVLRWFGDGVVRVDAGLPAAEVASRIAEALARPVARSLAG